MTKYTHSNIIIDPTKEGIESLIGKEVYFADQPYICLENANKDYNIGILEKIFKDSMYPFQVKTSEGEIRVFACIIVKKEPSYSERAKKWVEANDIKVGDYVKVTRKANENEHGWKGLWLDDMDESVAKTLMVKDIGICDNNIGLEDDYYYPYFVLEKAEKPEPKYVPFESKEEFIDAFHYHDNSNYSETDDILLNYGMWLESIEYDYGLVTRITDNAIKVGNSSLNWTYLLDHYTFLDGTPCGKEVMDE